MGLIAEKYSTALCKGMIKIKLCQLFTADSSGYLVDIGLEILNKILSIYLLLRVLLETFI